MNVVCHERGLSWTWSVLNVVCNRSVMKAVCYERGLLWTWSVMNVFLWTWSIMNGSVMNVVCYEWVCYECGLLWMWSVVNVVCCECGLLWMWSVVNVVCCECGLLWSGLLWMWSAMNGSVFEVVCNQRVCYEWQKWWTNVNHLKPKKAGQNSNAEVSTEMPVPDVIDSNQQQLKFERETQKLQQPQAVERRINAKKTIECKKKSCATSRKVYKQKQ